MATQSEDAIPSRLQHEASASDSEGEEAVLEYPSFPASAPGMLQLDPFNLPAVPEDVPAYLASLPSSQRKPDSSLPKRGLKDFEQNPTQLQASTLESSRQAMHDALLHTRTHAPKTRVLGTYDERSGETKIQKRKGNWLGTVGKDVAGGGVVLRREEALWAIERGSLDARFRVGAYGSKNPKRELSTSKRPSDVERGTTEDHSINSQQASDEDGLPMSLQAAYATLIDPRPNAPGDALTNEEYVVYAGLKRAGFIVLRARDTDRWKSLAVETHQADGRWVSRGDCASHKTNGLNILQWLINRVYPSKSELQREGFRLQHGPLVRPGLYRNYQDTFKLLALTTAEPLAPKPINTHMTVAQKESAYTTTFHVYKSNPARPFRKSDPGLPSFCICVINARTTRLPTLNELESLQNEQSVDELSSTTIDNKNKRNIGQVYGALKRGHRHVILAIVDEGITSYMRVADAVFAHEGRLFERPGFGTIGSPSAKRKGSGKNQARRNGATT